MSQPASPAHPYWASLSATTAMTDGSGVALSDDRGNGIAVPCWRDGRCELVDPGAVPPLPPVASPTVTGTLADSVTPTATRAG